MAAVAGAHAPGIGLTAAMSAAVPILGGLCASLAQRLNRARHDRLAALARERAAVARTARADERRRLAAGMHDTPGHLLTLLVLHANALTVRTSDPVASAAAEQMSRQGNAAPAEQRSGPGPRGPPGGPGGGPNPRRHTPGGVVTVVVTVNDDTVGVVVRNGRGTAPGHLRMPSVDGVPATAGIRALPHPPVVVAVSPG